MQRTAFAWPSWLRWLVSVLTLLGLVSCGGGGGGSPPPPPAIVATLIGFPTGGVPAGAVSPGFNSAASVLVLDATSGAPRADATVTINGTALVYLAALQAYIGELTVDPGATVSLTVGLDGATYSAATSQFSAYPTITSPSSRAVWSAGSDQVVAWSGTAPSPSTRFAVAVLDTSGQFVWPPGDTIEVVPSTTTSVTIGAGSLSAGERLVLVGATTALPISGADAQSAFVIGGFNYVAVTVTSGPSASLVSIAISPDRPTLSKGGTRQLSATGRYSDNSTRDLTAQVTWSSSASAIATVSATGMAGGVDFGSTTVSATLGGVSGSTIVTVFQPTPSPSPPLAQSVAYQIDYAHSGRASFGTTISFPPNPTWSVTLPGATSYPLIAGGKVFVTTTSATPNNAYGTLLHAFDASTGAPAWGPVPIPGTYYWSGHAYDHGRLFVVNFDGLLQSFDAASGQPGWVTQLPGQYAFSSPPTAVNGVVYVGGAGTGGTLYAVDQRNGGVLWTAPVANGDQSSPAVSTDGVFVSYPCQVYKFDPLSGSPLWHYNGGCSGGGGRTTAYADNRLYVREGFNNTMKIFDAALGTLVGSTAAGPMPALSGASSYVSSGGTLRSIDVATQRINWSFTGDGQLVSAPIVIDGHVIVGSASGNVYALNAGTGTQLWVGAAGAAIPAPDEHNVSQPLTGFGAGEGLLVVPAGRVLTAWRLSGP